MATVASTRNPVRITNPGRTGEPQTRPSSRPSARFSQLGRQKYSELTFQLIPHAARRHGFIRMHLHLPRFASGRDGFYGGLLCLLKKLEVPEAVDEQLSSPVVYPVGKSNYRRPCSDVGEVGGVGGLRSVMPASNRCKYGHPAGLLDLQQPLLSLICSYVAEHIPKTARGECFTASTGTLLRTWLSSGGCLYILVFPLPKLDSGVDLVRARVGCSPAW